MSLTYADIIKKMDLEQKCALFGGATAFGTRAYPKLNIPELQFSDGPHGMRHQDPATANHLGIGGSMTATCFPTAVTVSNSWDPTLAERLGAALGKQAAIQGVHDVLGPGLCIKRSPLCGRNFEYISEDPFLAGKMAAGYVRGIQSKGVAACPKHFAVNSQETRRQASDSVLDERTLREIYLTGFEIVVKEAHPQSIMSSYNLVNGTYANENQHLLKDILKGEWGFNGAVVTDWGGSNDHVKGVEAGSTFEMPAAGLDSVRSLIKAIQAGQISEAVVDERVNEALELIFSTDPAVRAHQGQKIDFEADHTLARQIAAEGCVLLKNDAVDGKPLLPLAPHTRVAVVGDFAKNPRYQGAGSSLVNSYKVDSILDAVRSSDDLEFIGYEQGFTRTGTVDEQAEAALRKAAAHLASSADVVLVCLGLDELAESEGIDRATMSLNHNQIQTLEAVEQTNPHVVVLLSAGSSVETDWVAHTRSLLYLALGGEAGGAAAVDVITGKVNPSGKLAESWAKRLADTPTYGNFPSDKRTAEYREGIYVGYRYYLSAGVPVAFPFGFGLSYTSFAYSNIEATPDAVSFDITNTGNMAGAEIAQLYVSKRDAVVFRPARELKGFAKVTLSPGETRHVTVSLDDKAFRFFDVSSKRWEIEKGTYTLEVGASSEDIRLSAEVTVKGTVSASPYAHKNIGAYATGKVRELSDANFAALLDRPIPNPQLTIDRNICFRDLKHTRSVIFWVVGMVLSALKRKSEASGKPDLNIEFIYNMPMRALQKNAGQFVSMGLVDAIVRELKGWGVAGVVPALLVKLLTGKFFILVWALWVLVPLVWEFAVNLVINMLGERRLARKGGK